MLKEMNIRKDRQTGRERQIEDTEDREFLLLILQQSRSTRTAIDRPLSRYRLTTETTDQAQVILHKITHTRLTMNILP